MRSVNTARERATGALRARYYTPAWTTPKAVLAGTPEALLPRKHSSITTGLARAASAKAAHARLPSDRESRTCRRRKMEEPTEQFATSAPARAAPAKRKRPVPAGILEEQPVNALEQTRPAKRLRKASKKRAAADEAAVAEGAAPPPKRQKGAADQQRDAKARARVRVLTGGPLEKKEVRGLTVVEMQAFAVAMGLSDVRVLQPMGFSKLPCKRDKLFVVCESWFDTHDGPFVLSEDRAGELRLKWPDAEARAALLPEKRKQAPVEPLPPPDAATLEQFEACGARVACLLAL